MKTTKKSKSLISFVLSFCMVVGFMIPTYAEVENKLISKWTFEDQAEVDSMVTQSVSSKSLSDGTLYIQGSGFPFIFPFNGKSLIEGKEYILSFDAKAGEAATQNIAVQTSAFSAGDQYLSINTETMSHFEYQFTAESSNAPMIVLLNGGDCSGYYDNIYLYEVGVDESIAIKNKVIKGVTFADQTEVDSMVTQSVSSKSLSEGALYIQGGAFPFIFPFDGMALTVGKEYILSFDAKAGEATTQNIAVQTPAFSAGDQYLSINTETMSHFEYQFTAESSNAPMIVLLNGGDCSGYYDNIYLYEVTKPASIVSSTPAEGTTVYPTNKIEIEFSDELSDDALTAASWTLTDGNGDTISVSSVEKSGNKYTLNLADTTKNMMSYELIFEGLKSIYNHPLVTTSLEFVSYEGETVLFYPFSSAETSTWVYLQNGSGTFYNTDEYYSAPGSRWVNIEKSNNVYIKNGVDGSNNKLEVGQEYTVSFWAKPYVENGVDASNVSVVRLNEGDKQFAGTWSFSGTDWQFFKSTFIQQGSGHLYFYFDYKDASLPVKMYVDDFKITKNVPLADFEIVSSNPENESAVGIVDSITVNFTQTPGNSAMDIANYTLEGGTQTVTDAKISGDSVTLMFSESLSENTEYILTVNIKDIAGRALTGRNAISFTSVANVLYKNYLSQDADFERPVFKEHATKEGNVAIFNMSNEKEIYPFQNNSYEDIKLEVGKKYSIMFKAATTEEGNAQHFALVNGDNASFVKSIYDLSTEMKTYTVEFTANTTSSPFFRMYTADAAIGAKVLIDDIVLYEVIEDVLYLEDMKLFANYGTDTQYEIGGNSVVEGDISVVIEEGANCTGTEQKVMLAIAVYEDDVLKNVSMDEFLIGNGKVIEDALYTSAKVPAQTEGVKRTVKAFVWNANTYEPFADSRVLSD